MILATVRSSARFTCSMDLSETFLCDLRGSAFQASFEFMTSA
jgi:hypothetical protein